MKPIELEQVGKYYRIYANPRDRLVELLTGRSRHTGHWALQGVDLSLEKGEAVGVIGNNGAGKSTLLKLIAGTLLPSTGRLRCRGRLTAILELGTGFHPEFSGRENLYYAASLMGVARQEVAQRFDAIVAFAGLEAVIDQPLKTYSTGMVVRLAFSLVTSIDPEILIIDEALAVGDRSFQKRCLDRMVEIQQSGTTILFCSHSMHHVMQFCSRALWLEQGRVRELGPVSTVVDHYIAASLQGGAPQVPEAGRIRQAQSANRCQVAGIELSPSALVRRGEPLQVAFGFTVLEASHYTFGVALELRDTATRLVAETTLENGIAPVWLETGRYTFTLRVDTSPLRSGAYTLFAGLLDDTLLQIEDYEEAVFELVDSEVVRSPAMIRANVDWDLDGRFFHRDSA